MMDLCFRLKDPLDNPNDGTGKKTKSLLKGSRLGPGGSALSFVQQAHVEHLVQYVVVQLTSGFEEDFRRSNTPTPDTVMTRTLFEFIRVPMSKGLTRSTHLDLAFQHPINDLTT